MIGVDKNVSKEFYDNQAVNQIYKKQNQKNKYKQIESPRYEPGNLQIDIQFFTRFPKKINRNYIYLLNILDVYSRYVKSYPLKNKKSDSVLPHIREYIKEFRKIYPKNEISITLDAGTEFLGGVKKYLDKKEIKIYIATPGMNTKNRNYLVERFHKTFWEKLRKVLTHEESLSWVDYYSDIIENYNNTIHSKTGATPKSIFIDKEIRTAESFLKRINIENKFEIGDVVRVLKNKKNFTKKSFTANWSINKYKISSIEGKRYFVSYMNGNDKKGSYLSRELQKVNDDVEDKTIYKEKTRQHKKLSGKIRKLKREKIGDVNDEGEIITNKRLKVKNEKRISKKPDRLMY